jgi:hypothetical protein
VAFYSDAESGRTRLINSGPGAISTIVWIDVPNVKKKDGEHIVLCKKEQENVILVEVLTSSGTRNYGADGFVERKGWKWGGGGGKAGMEDDGITLVQRTHEHTHAQKTSPRYRKKQKINTNIMNI